jgi:hypothetical protein
MILDNDLMAWDNEDASGTAGTEYSAAMNIGDIDASVGVPNMRLWVQVMEDSVADDTDGTAKISVCAGSTATPTTVIYETAAIAVGTLVEGYQFNLGTLPGGVGKYVRFLLTRATQTFDTLTLSGGIVIDTQDGF